MVSEDKGVDALRQGLIELREEELTVLQKEETVGKPYIPEAYIRETSRIKADAERDKLLCNVAKKSARRAELYWEKHHVKWW